MADSDYSVVRRWFLCILCLVVALLAVAVIVFWNDGVGGVLAVTVSLLVMMLAALVAVGLFWFPKCLTASYYLLLPLIVLLLITTVVAIIALMSAASQASDDSSKNKNKAPDMVSVITALVIQTLVLIVVWFLLYSHVKRTGEKFRYKPSQLVMCKCCLDRSHEQTTPFAPPVADSKAPV